MSRSSLNAVKIKRAKSRQRPTYHHGDLRAALIRAADEIIAEAGIEGFSLRAAAQRAGVSQSAPAHHFGSAKGLLTEVAVLAFARLGEYLDQAGRSDDTAVDLRALGLASVNFALDHPGHFRLMFRHDLINRDDPRYSASGFESRARLGQAVAAYHGKAEIDLHRFDDAADLFGTLSTMHGLAHMVLSEKATHFFERATSRDFVEKDLPKLLERLYPSKTSKPDAGGRTVGHA
jgi:AcrR family transcriptional regulator